MSLTTTPTDSPAAERNGHVSAENALVLKKNLASLKKGADLGTVSESQWTHWQDHLASREGRPALAKVTSAFAFESLLWGLPNGQLPEETRELLRNLGAAKRKKRAASRSGSTELASNWLAERSDREMDVALAVECLTWAHSMPALAAFSEQSLWCELLLTLSRIAHDAAAIHSEAKPLIHALAAGELPLALAYVLPEVELGLGVKGAKVQLSEGLLSVLDGEGQFAFAHAPVARGLLGCWTRCQLLGKAMKKRPLDSEARAHLKWFLRHTIAAMRADGTPMLVTKAATTNDLKLLEIAFDALGKTTEHKLANLNLPSRNKPGKQGKRTPKRLPNPATNSEWAEMALLRSSWNGDSPRLLLDYSGENVRTELVTGKHVVWSGECSPVVRVDGETLALTTPWSEVCWHSDDDVDFIEIEAGLSGGWKCQRQFLLARQDRFLLAADVLLGPQPAKVEYQCDWPIGKKLHVSGEKETTECVISKGKKNVTRVLPLALPEWKSDGRRSGLLSEAGGALRYSLAREGKHLYAPLLLDLDQDRMKYDYTWRQLSVGRNLEAVPLDEAVGYRVQLRLDQWLIYRSLAAQASRTILGQNYFHEFVCARFERCGDVEALVEVE